ncbi:response regulator transcription factor [Alkalihalobacillus sp. LMS39]|uniref:response regulator transcription factor n=1 Tax=Alkalihalobacillus sp. LMS39 TaxID=2924032 RepID=UPI001FB51882|nr:response regulator transcription factor [Alkalihalobacillus sp. LMS39]UOE95762.1 response regulator transcription factor [Alkalihalobacillus sp. LMS39]
MYKLMVIEDDEELRSLTKESLERYGFDVYVQTDFKTILEDFQSLQPDLVLLDINLPYYDGYFLCRSIRAKSTVPIIMISARSADMDQIMAIELGADDYITKPFTLDILVSKVKATIRRVYGEYAKDETTILRHGDFYVDSAKLVMGYRERLIEVSKNECRLIVTFMKHQNQFVAREALIEEVWDDVTFVDDNTLTVNMSRIKQKLAELGLPNLIKSKRGVGYMMQDVESVGKFDG